VENNNYSKEKNPKKYQKKPFQKFLEETILSNIFFALNKRAT
jgi:hypothetical protein